MKIKVPFALIMLVASLILTFAGPQAVVGGPMGAMEATAAAGGLSGIVATILKVGPILILVLGIVGLFVKGRVIPEAAAVVCYAMGAAFLLRALGNFMFMEDMIAMFDGDIEMMIQSISIAPLVCYIFSGWIYFLVAARIQDDENVGGHGALGTLGCMLVVVTGGIATAGGFSLFNVIPMLLQIGYIKRLPRAFTYTKGITTVKNLIYVIVLMALYFVGPSLGIRI